MARRRKRGEVFARVRVHGPNGQTRTLRLLVDTGSTYTWIPARVAKSLGVIPRETVGIEVGDGRIVERPGSDVDVELEGRRGTTFVVFGEPGDARVLGLVALERFPFEVDPVNRVLRHRKHAFVGGRAVRFAIR